MIATGPGLICAACGGEMAVTDSRPGPDCIRRRRRCLDPSCTAPRVTTYERIEDGDPQWLRPIAIALGTLSEKRRRLVTKLIRELGGQIGENDDA